MGYVLIWIEALAAAILGQATCLSLSVRPGLFRLTGLISVALFLAVAGCFVAAAPPGDAVPKVAYAILVCVLLGAVIWGRRKGMRRTLEMLSRATPYFVAFVVFSLALGAAIATGMLEINLIQKSWFEYALSWLVCHLIMTAIVFLWGNRKSADGRSRSCAAWPVGRLALAFAAASALSLMTFWNMDTAVKAHFGVIRGEASARMMALAPLRLPDNKNAALLYQRAFDTSAAPMEESEALLKIANGGNAGEPIPENVRQEIASYLDASRGALAYLRQAGCMEACSFERDRSERFGYFPEMSKMRGGARLLKLSVMKNVNEGRSSEALTDLKTIFAMAQHLSQDPLVLSLLVSAAIQDMGLQGLQLVLASGPFDAALLKQDSFNFELSYQRRLQHGLRMEEAMMLSTFSEIAEDATGPRLATTFAGSGYYFTGSGYHDPAEAPLLLRMSSPFLRVFLLQDDLGDYQRVMRELRRVCAERSAHQTKFQTGIEDREMLKIMEGSGLITRAIAPVLGRMLSRMAQADAALRLAQLGVAMTRYKVVEGRYPDKLERLAPRYLDAVPLDPFDGQPMKLKTSPEAIVIYSIGRDGKDDGGKPKEAEGQMDFDLTLRLKV